MYKNLFVILSCVIVAVIIIAVPFEQTDEYFAVEMAWHPIWTPINSAVYAKFIGGAILRIVWPVYIAQIVFVGLGSFVIYRLAYGPDEPHE